MFLGMLLDFCTNRLAEQIPSVGPLIELCPDVVYFIGVWMLTSPEPVESDRVLGIRAITRSVGVLAVAFDVVFAAVSYIPTVNLFPLRGVGLILGSVVLFLIAFHLAALSVRIPDFRLAAQSRFVISGLAVIALLLGGFVLYIEKFPSVRESIRGNTLVIAAAIPVVLVTFVFAFWCLWIFHRFHKLTMHEPASKGIT